MKRALLLAPSLTLCAAATALCAAAGSVEFAVTTKPKDDKYSPRHVLAIWVTTSDGAFVKTLMIQGRKGPSTSRRGQERPGRTAWTPSPPRPRRHIGATP